MDELQVFNNEEFGEIRTVTIDSEPWFVGKDVAVALGYRDTVNALKSHVDDEDKIRGWQITTPSGTQEMTIINESGLYALIFGSKLESAKRFKHWVTSEVLPAIRKTGTYSMRKHKPTRPLTTDDYADAARTVAKCHTQRLPIVLGFYEIGGFEIPKIQEKVKEIEDKPVQESDAEWAQVREILNGYSLRDAAEKSGIPYVSLCYYRNGKRKPPEDRCSIIINVLG